LSSPRSRTRSNKARLIEKIAELVREKTIEGISDLRDESDRDGMRIVIDLKRGEMPDVVLNNLYKHTALQSSFGIIMLAIVGGRPRVLSLVEMIDQFRRVRREVVRRRTEFDLRKAEARPTSSRASRSPSNHLDEVIALIRASRNPGRGARGAWVATFGLSVVQAQAILDMQLQRLTGSNGRRSRTSCRRAQDDRAAARHPGQRAAPDGHRGPGAEAGPRDLRRRPPDRDHRRERRVSGSRDLIADEDAAITVTHTGYVKRTAVTSYRNQQRGGKGRIGMRFREEDFVDHLFVASTHDYLMVFSDRGRAYWLKVHAIPDVGPDGKGKAIANLVSMADGEKIASLLAVKTWDEDKVRLHGHPQGHRQEDAAVGVPEPPGGGIIAMGVENDDAVIAVPDDGRDRGDLRRDARRDGHPVPRDRRPADGTHRPTGCGASASGKGTAWWRWRSSSPEAAATVLTVCENGYGKRTDLDEYRVQSRGGVGIISIHTTSRNGRVSGWPTCAAKTS